MLRFGRIVLAFILTDLKQIILEFVRHRYSNDAKILYDTQAFAANVKQDSSQPEYRRSWLHPIVY
ncbi:hypothetical protein D3C74_481280 [compost metagenome]